MSDLVALEQSTSNFENLRAEYNNSRCSKYHPRAAKLIKKFAHSTDPESQEIFRLKLRQLQKGLSVEQRQDLEKKKDQYLTFSSETTFSPENTDKVVHEGVKCDGCSQLPIIGTRYKCSECVDFDYCEDCEGKLSHKHPFIQMKKPEQQYSGSSSMASIPGKVPPSQRSKQASRKWKPSVNLRDNVFDEFEGNCEGYGDDEDYYLVSDESQNRQENMTETVKQIFISEVQEKTQKLSELFCEKDSQKIKEFVAKNYYLSVEALVEKWLLA